MNKKELSRQARAYALNIAVKALSDAYSQSYHTNSEKLELAKLSNQLARKAQKLEESRES